MGRSFARRQAAVEGVHQPGRRLIVDVPQPGHDAAAAGAEKGPGEPDQAFARVRALAGAAARRDGHQFGAERHGGDVAGVEPEAVGRARQDDGGIERALGVRGRVRREMDHVEASGSGLDIRRGSRTLALQPRDGVRRKVPGDRPHLGARMAERRILRIARRRVADEQEGAAARVAAARGRQHGQRRRHLDLHVLDPIVTPRAVNRQRLEVEPVQRAVRHDHHRRVARNPARRRGHERPEQAIAWRSRGAARGERVREHALERRPVRADQGRDLPGRRKRRQVHAVPRHRPQVGPLRAEPVEQEHRTRAGGDLGKRPGGDPGKRPGGARVDVPEAIRVNVPAPARAAASTP